MILHKASIAYAATTLASSAMNSLFFFYYVKLFLDNYHVSQGWFNTAQVMYMIWNAINDPLFGYFQDNSSWEICRERRKSIYYGAPIWAICFMLPWFPWGHYEPGSWVAGLHLMFTLCAYDALLTFVLLAQCALFTEMSEKHEDRLRLVKYSQVASVVGSTSVFLSSVVSNNMESIFRLQMFCLFIALVSTVCMRYTGMHAYTQYIPSSASKPLLPTSQQDAKQEDNLSFKGWLLITVQIMKNKNFLSFVFMNFFQVFHLAFCGGFLIIFADHLIPSDVLPSIGRSAVYGASFFVPQVMVLLCGGIIQKFGSFNVIMSTFFMQCGFAVIMYFMGRQSYWLLALFLIFDMSLPNATFSIFNIPVSDIIDQDKEINAVKNPRSSMVFGTNALITKPAQSLAPMLVVAILNKFGYEKLKDVGIPNAPQSLDDEVDEAAVNTLHDKMFLMLCIVPLVISGLQIILWSRYKLRNTHTVEAKYVET